MILQGKLLTKQKNEPRLQYTIFLPGLSTVTWRQVQFYKTQNITDELLKLVRFKSTRFVGCCK